MALRRKLKTGHRFGLDGPAKITLTFTGPCAIEVLVGKAEIAATADEHTEFVHERPGKAVAPERRRLLTKLLPKS